MSLKANILATMAYGGLCLVGIVSIGAIRYVLELRLSSLTCRRRWWVVFKIGHHVRFQVVNAKTDIQIGIIIMLGGVSLTMLSRI